MGLTRCQRRAIAKQRANSPVLQAQKREDDKFLRKLAQGRESTVCLIGKRKAKQGQGRKPLIKWRHNRQYAGSEDIPFDPGHTGLTWVKRPFREKKKLTKGERRKANLPENPTALFAPVISHRA